MVSSRKTSAPSSAPRIALALAGGGPLGAVHEIGALCALEEALPGLDFTALNAYVGVSAGAFIAAGLANGMTPRQMCAAFIDGDGGTDDLIDPRLFTRPAWNEYRRRLRRLPVLLGRLGWQLLRGDLPLVNALGQLGGALPTGLFDNGPMQAQLQRVFSAPGRHDDFRKLRRPLVVVPTSTPAKPRPSASPAGTTPPSPGPSSPALPCPACTHRWPSAGATTSTAR